MGIMKPRTVKFTLASSVAEAGPTACTWLAGLEAQL